MSKISEQIQERRLARLRLGQAAFTIVTMVSDDEQRFALVPLTEAEYEEAMEIAAHAFAPDNVAGAAFRDRIEQIAVLVRALRDMDDKTAQAFDNEDDLGKALEPPDINHFYDQYIEMTTMVTPGMEGFDENSLDDLKKALQGISLSELSGGQWYALKRFLSTLSPTQLLDKSPGFSLTNSLTPTKSEEESTLSA